jgi:uncharacterized protein
MGKIILAFFVLSFAVIHAQQNQRYINVNGTSELILQADEINYTIQIKIINESLEKSKQINDKNVKELLKILKNSGIDSNDIEVSPLILGKNYENSDRERKQKGFYSTVNVSFILKDLSKYFDLTDQLSSNDSYEIVSSGYGISDYERQHKLAYEKALKAAREKAEYMTQTLGVKLGGVLEIDENNYGQTYPNPFNTVTKENIQGGNISGKVTIKRSVRVKFTIE